METKTVTKMSYNELESVVKKQYPKVKDYSFVAIEEANNDNVYEFTRINKKEYEKELEYEGDIKEMLEDDTDIFDGIDEYPINIGVEQSTPPNVITIIETAGYAPQLTFNKEEKYVSEQTNDRISKYVFRNTHTVKDIPLKQVLNERWISDELLQLK